MIPASSICRFYHNDGEIRGVVPSEPFGWYFNEIDDVVSVESDASLDNLGVLTLVCWINRSVAENTDYMIYKGTNVQLYVPGAVNDKFYCILKHDGQHGTSITDATMYNGNFRHFVATHDVGGDRKVRLYVDGAEGAYTTQDPSIGDRRDDSGSALEIGNAGGDNPAQGVFGELRVYNKVFSATDAKNDFELTRGRYGV